jgi:hypothetical protein
MHAVDHPSIMKTSTIVPMALAVLFAATIGLAGCREKGPGEQVGEAMDDFKDDVADTFDPKGPLEKAGRAIDRATD